MKKRNGFTLIELLAVIVVLAIIAVIAIPIITSVIDKAKMGALKDSGYGILDAAEMYLAKNMNKEKDTMEFICNNGVCLSGTEEISYKGQIEAGRVRIYSDSKIELCIENNNASALKTVTSKEVIVSKGTCNYEELNYGVTALVSKTAYDSVVNELNNLKNLMSQTNITASDISTGKIALINGELVIGNFSVKEQTISQTTSYYNSSRTVTFTFNELTQIYGVKQLTVGSDDYFYRNAIAISGNTVTFTIIDGGTAQSSGTITMTAVGY